uniref:Uncharacterized protein MANES_12G072100 n=1 Tax=Rhizophora mucronata TaxID=61149 RepID=A0A2P2JP71_RHIMU
MEVVEKNNVLVGDFMPSVKFTGNVRTCAYLDPTEPQHAKVWIPSIIIFIMSPFFTCLMSISPLTLSGLDQ